MITDLHTDVDVLIALRASVGQRMSADEMFEQRLSFVWSTCRWSSGITREQVRQQLLDHDGRAP